MKGGWGPTTPLGYRFALAAAPEWRCVRQEQTGPFDGVHGSLRRLEGGDAQQPAGAAGQTSTMPPSDMMTCPVI